MDEWSSKKLSEIFNSEQRKKLKKFIREHEDEDPMELTKKLKEMFGEWKEDLEKKGLLPDYLAYAFAYQWKRFGSDRVIHELRKVL